MDRRDALKKLGAGSAVAIGAPVILPAFHVAAAGSGTLRESPLPGPVQAWIVQNGNFYDVNITLPTVDCSVTGTADVVSTEWQITSFSENRGGSNDSLTLTAAGLSLTKSESADPTAWTIGPLTGVRFSSSRGDFHTQQTSFVVKVRVTWGGCSPGATVFRVYVFTKPTGTNVATVSVEQGT